MLASLRSARKKTFVDYMTKNLFQRKCTQIIKCGTKKSIFKQVRIQYCNELFIESWLDLWPLLLKQKYGPLRITIPNFLLEIQMVILSLRK